MKKNLKNSLVLVITIFLLGTNFVSNIAGDTQKIINIQTEKIYESNIEILNSDINSYYDWVKNAGGSSHDQGFSVDVDSEGNSYITGCFSEEAFFGSITLNAEISYDVFVAKLNNNGNFEWAVSAGGYCRAISQDINVDVEGNIYITGSFDGTANFGQIQLESNGKTDVFVAKLDSSGSWLWATRAGGLYYDYSQGIEVDENENVFLTGYFMGSAVFGSTTLISKGSADIFVAKLNPSGDFLWAVSAGGIKTDLCYDISVDLNGNSYITGYFNDISSFGDINLSSLGDTDVYIAKLNPSGNYLWAVSGGGTSTDVAYDIVVDDEQFIYVTGFFYYAASFGSISMTADDNADLFLVKLDYDGNWLQGVDSDGNSYESGYSIDINESGNIYVTGCFYEDAIFGESTFISNGNRDVFVAKLNSNLEWQWAKSGGGIYADIGHGISSDSSGNCYVTGEFLLSPSFDSNLLKSNGIKDIFILKLSEDLSVQPDLFCDGDFNWNDVKPGETVTGFITVENVGDPDSLLDWEVESYPDWGTWSFNPNNGFDLLAGDSVTIDVEVVAPNEEEKEFTGEIVLVNIENNSDICTIQVSLVTPVSQQHIRSDYSIDTYNLKTTLPIPLSVSQTSSASSDIKINNVNNIESFNLDVELFSQPPSDPSGQWDFSASTDLIEFPPYGVDVVIYENFLGVDGTISGVKWWGLALYVNPMTGEYDACIPDVMFFEIIFYEDDNGEPGNIITTLIDVVPTFTSTGDTYMGFQSYLFECNLTEDINLSEGWISIQNTYTFSGCWFFWLSSETGDKHSLIYDRDNDINPTKSRFDRSLVLTGDSIDMNDNNFHISENIDESKNENTRVVSFKNAFKAYIWYLMKNHYFRYLGNKIMQGSGFEHLSTCKK